MIYPSNYKFWGREDTIKFFTNIIEEYDWYWVYTYSWNHQLRLFSWEGKEHLWREDFDPHHYTNGYIKRENINVRYLHQYNDGTFYVPKELEEKIRDDKEYWNEDVKYFWELGSHIILSRYSGDKDSISVTINNYKRVFHDSFYVEDDSTAITCLTELDSRYFNGWIDKWVVALEYETIEYNSQELILLGIRELVSNFIDKIIERECDRKLDKAKTLFEDTNKYVDHPDPIQI